MFKLFKIFAVLYTTLLLVQLSFSQENEPETPQDLSTTLSVDEFVETDEIVYKQTPPIEDSDDTVKSADDNPSNEKADIENTEEPLEPTNIKLYDDSAKDPTPNGCEESCVNASLDEEIAAEENSYNNDAGSKTTITLSNPVKAGGKVTIVTYYGCEDDNSTTDISTSNDDPISNEIVPKACDEPISFSGCAKAQGKVSIAAHFGCGDNSKNFVTLCDENNKATDDDDDISDNFISFGGPVRAQGKVSVGTHYGCGCGAPFGTPPTFLPPWFYPRPRGSCFGYPSPMSETFNSQEFQDHTVNESGNMEDSRPCLPVASILANSMAADSQEKDQRGNAVFNGIVPACGTVSIAARF